MPIQQTLLFDFDNEDIKKNHPEEDKVVPDTVDNAVAQQKEIIEEPAASVATPAVKVIAGTGKKIGRGRFKMEELDTISGLVEIPQDEVLFAKKYYPIGTVAEMFKVNVSLIRFWENEFPVLKPKKNGKGDRLFRPEDIKSLKLIHHLLREKKFTIEGAKDFIKKNKRAEENFELIETLKKTKQFLTEIKLGL